MGVPFLGRVRNLPFLGLGVSTEYGAASVAGGLNLDKLRRDFPEFAGFLEIGVEVARGLDATARNWVAAGGKTTYHFLDINLDEPADLDSEWVEAARAIVSEICPAWGCGDAGLWHLGRRERGQMLLLPPILSADSAAAFAVGVAELRSALGLEVFPENPPGVAFVGDLHLLDFYSRVCEQADTGMLLDCAHLAIYQAATGRSPLDGLAEFPLDRVVEIHVAGAVERKHGDFSWIADEHTVAVRPETWKIVEYVMARACNLKAVVFECERNPIHAVLPGFRRLSSLLAATTRVRA